MANVDIPDPLGTGKTRRVDVGGGYLAPEVAVSLPTGTTFPVTTSPAKGTPSAPVSVAVPNNAAGSAVSVLAANANRRVALIQNAGTQRVYLGWTNGVVSTSGLFVDPGQTLRDTDTTAQWFGNVAAGAGIGDLRVTELV